METLLTPLSFKRGAGLKNRLALSPLTNSQSHAAGVLSDDEFHWLTMRAQGGFGLVMTCAAHVQAMGQGFPGQLGVWDDRHVPGLSRLAAAIKAHGASAWMQLHHAGMRSPPDLIGATPVAPSPVTGEHQARGLEGEEVVGLVEDFITAAVRAEHSGFDGVELHGAHGYILAQFLSAEINQRTDQWGGSAENRARILHAIIDGVRARCGPNFQLGVRLSPERFGLNLGEIRDLAGALMAGGAIDMLDLSLWNWRKTPENPLFEGRTLLAHFTDLPRHGVRLTGAGRIMTAADAREALEQGLDFVMFGRAAILHHDLARRIAEQPDFAPIATPVPSAYLRNEGLGPVFIDYMRNWKGFVAD